MLREGYQNLPYEEFTEEEKDRYNLEMTVWDMYKEVHGLRPRWMPLQDMTDEALNREIALLSEQISDEIRRQERDRAELIEARAHPRGVVWLSPYGELCQEHDGDVDPNDPECWRWAIRTEAPANNPFAALLQGA